MRTFPRARFLCASGDDAPHTLADEVTRIGPVELITNDLAKLRDCIAREDLSMSEQPAAGFQYQNASEALCRHFHLQDLSPLGLTDEYVWRHRRRGR